jgi:hypothetical protein
MACRGTALVYSACSPDPRSERGRVTLVLKTHQTVSPDYISSGSETRAYENFRNVFIFKMSTYLNILLSIRIIADSSGRAV